MPMVIIVKEIDSTFKSDSICLYSAQHTHNTGHTMPP